MCQYQAFRCLRERNERETEMKIEEFEPKVSQFSSFWK